MRKAGEILKELFNEQFGPQFMETARSTSSLFSSWPRLVAEVWPRSDETLNEAEGGNGKSASNDVPAVALHSKIAEMEKGVLLVEADHPGWIQVLQTKQGELLSAVQRLYPQQEIRAIAFRLSRKPFTSP